MNSLILFLTIAVSQPVIKEKIYFPEPIKTEFYVEAILSSGNQITVPIINGYIPTVSITGSVREFTYESKNLYKSSPIYYKEKRVDCDCKKEIERLEKMIKQLQKVEEKTVPMPIEKSLEKMQFTPFHRTEMKKPSEFE